LRQDRAKQNAEIAALRLGDLGMTLIDTAEMYSQLHGEKSLAAVELTSSQTGHSDTVECLAAFVFIGSTPTPLGYGTRLRLMATDL
jgi:hypothetical protein